MNKPEKGEKAEEGTKMPPLPSKIVVPDDVKAKWKAVIFEVTDKDTNEKTDYTVNIGDTTPLGDTGLNISVEAFLPSFQMRGDVFTSNSTDPNNPAAKVKITDESGKELYDRWLFSLYPATHPFEHQKYGVILKNYVAEK